MGVENRQYASDRVPEFGDNRRFVVAFVAVFLVICILGEVWARNMGVVPMVNDTPSSWALMRDSVEPEDIVIIGTSRGQRAMDPAVLDDFTAGQRVVQLARSGTGVLPVLEHFAEDESFRGTLIVDIHPNHWQYPGERLPGNLNGRALVGAYTNRASSLALEMWLGGILSRRLAILSPEFTPDGIVRAIGQIEPIPGQDILRFTERRFVEFDTRWFDEEEHDLRQARKNENLAESAVADPASVREAALELSTPTELLRERGVRVIFVRTPSSKHSRERENHRVPREIVYDVLVAEVGGEWLHFEDVEFDPELNCPDGSHLDAPSAHRFTAWLGETLFGSI